MGSELNVLLSVGVWSEEAVSRRHDLSGRISLPGSSLCSLCFMITITEQLATPHHVVLALQLVSYELNSLQLLSQINPSSFNSYG